MSLHFSFIGKQKLRALKKKLKIATKNWQVTKMFIFAAKGI